MHNKDLTETARKLRKNMTPHENQLWFSFFRHYPLRIRRQKAIGNFVVDFYCSKAKLVIEIDGGQHYTDEGMKKDRERTAFIETFGIKVIRFSNTDVVKNFDGVCTAIDMEIRERAKAFGIKTTVWE